MDRKEAVRTQALFWAAVATGLCAAASPSTSAARTSQRLVGAADLFRLAEAAEKRGDLPATEKILRALLADPSPQIRSEARFRLAKLFAGQGRRSEAAVLMRRVLDDNPGATPVRLHLAGLLQELGHEDSALRELRALRTADLPPNVARFVDRISAALQARKPFGVQLELAVAPDSNINRATRSETLGTLFGDFTFEEDSKARSGFGAAVRAMAHGRLPVTRDVSLTARLVGDASLYRHKAFNDISVELAGGPEMRLGSTRLGAEVGLGQQWYGMQPYQRSMRLSASVAQPVDAVSQLRLDGTLRWANNKLNDLQDGSGHSLRARYERALSERLTVAASIGMDRFKARDDAYSTRSWQAGLSAYRELGRMTLSAGADVARLKADERLSILPEAREDRLTRFHLGAVFRQMTVAGFAPTAKIVVERNRSSVEFYDYKRTTTEFGISRAF